MQIIKDQNILEIYAERFLKTEGKNRNIDKNMPYISMRTELVKRVILHKVGQQTFDLKNTLKFLLEEDMGDLTVSSFGILVRDKLLKELTEKKIKKKIIDDRFVLIFKGNIQSGKEFRIRQQIANIMQFQTEKYGFHIASLDLIGIYAHQDYFKNKQLNLLGDIEKNDETLREISGEYFKEFITVQGVQKKIKAIKYYETDSKDVLVLKDFKVI